MLGSHSGTRAPAQNVAVVGSSGISPVLSIASTLLAREPKARFGQGVIDPIAQRLEHHMSMAIGRSLCWARRPPGDWIQ